jgi:Heavy-metal resistance
MNPLFKLLAFAAPAVAVGGLLLYSPSGQADERSHGSGTVLRDGKSKTYTWSSTGGNSAGEGISVTGIRDLVRDRLRAARQAVSSLPAPVRDKVLARFDRVNAIVDRRLSRIDFNNLDTLDDQLEGLDDEIEAAMEGLSDEIEALTEHFGLSQKLKQLGDLRLHLHTGGSNGSGGTTCQGSSSRVTCDTDAGDDDDWNISTMPIPPTPPAPPVPPAPPAPPSPPDPPSYSDGDDDIVDVDDGDLEDLDLQLRPDQRSSLRAARQEADARVRPAREALDKLSSQLTATLRNVNVSPAQVSSLVDQISAQEATIRKARIVAWVKSRAVLDARQRTVLEDSP